MLPATLTGPDLRVLSARLAASLASPRVIVGPPGVDPGLAGVAAGRGPVYACLDLLLRQERGDDPTGPWREALEERTRRQYGERPPPALSAAFVLIWYAEVVAYPLAFAAALGPWLLDAAPAAVTFALQEDGSYPAAVALAGGGWVVAEEQERAQQAYQAYRRHLDRFAASYEPGVKLGAQHRLGSVTDTWAAVERRATAAALAAGRREPGPSTGPALRESCCFIYLLPGAHECASCPRRSGR